MQPASQTVSAEAARRLLLGAQGLLGDPACRAGPASLQRLIERMGFVQIDTINVVERAHHLTLHSRLDDYRPRLLSTLLEEKRSLFEHWTHDASVIPTRWFAHWRPRFERYRVRDPEHAWWKARMGPDARTVIDSVLKRIEREGPLMSRDFDAAAAGPDISGVTDTWWQWRPHKAALEYLWRCGEIAVARRVNFQKVYDLTHRVVPQWNGSEAAAPDLEGHIDWACRSALERLGTATPRELAAFWNAIDLAAARRWCDAAQKRGEIVEVMVESMGDEPPRAAFAFPDWRARLTRLPAAPDRTRLLSPFDPVVRDRARTRRLFGFDYTIEVFVPAARRRYGYWVMPILEGERLIGRADLKSHRDRGELEVKGLWWEPGVRPTKARRAALETALLRLGELVGTGQLKGHGRSRLTPAQA